MQTKKEVFVFSGLFFLSGSSALLYQVVWTKKLALLYGITTHAVSTTLSVFMLGLALGSWYFGSLADRSPRPLKMYMWLEAGIAASAALSLLLLELMNNVVTHLGFSSSFSAGFTACRLIGSFIVLIIPTFLMGGTAPVLAKVLIRSSDHAGAKLGLLYAANTLGGVVGCFLAGFVVMASLGLQGTVLLGVAGNLIVALLAGMILARTTLQAAPTDNALNSAPQTIHPAPSSALTQTMLIAFFLSGFLGLALEVVWTRLLLMHLEASAQTFAGMLATYLLGLALGSMLFGKLSDKMDCIRSFAAFQLATGLTIAATVFFWPPWARGNLAAIGASYGTHKLLLSLLHTATLVFIPTFAMGCAFPLIARFFSTESASLGRRLGSAYMLNTVGCMLGPLVSGFMWLPYAGVQKSLVLCALGYLACGAIVLLARLKWKPFQVGAGLAILLAAGTLMLKQPDLVLPIVTETRSTKLVYHEEDVTGSVFVLDHEIGGEAVRQLTVGATSMIANNFRCRRYTHLIGDLPMLMHPAPRKALVICLGSGMTLSAVASHPDLQSADCADLSEGVINAARFYYANDNARVLEDPRVHVIINDGRTHLLATQERYDVIALEPPPPNNAGVSNLYSMEFYQLCKSRLNPGGLIAQWIPYHLMSLAQIRSAVATMQAVFPTTTFWELYAGKEYCVIGHREGEIIPYDRLIQRLSAPAVHEQLSAVGIRNADDLLACFAMGPQQAARFGADAPLITDDHPGLGYDLSAFDDSTANPRQVSADLLAAMLITSEYSEDPATFFKFNNLQDKTAFQQREAPIKKAWLMNGRAVALTMTEELRTELLVNLAHNFEAPILLDPENRYYRDRQKNGMYTKALARLANFYEQAGDTENARKFKEQLQRLPKL